MAVSIITLISPTLTTLIALIILECSIIELNLTFVDVHKVGE